MKFTAPVRAAAILTLLFSVVCGAPVRAQEPPATSVALAKELILLKGGNSMLDPIIPGVIESAKNVLLQTSPMLAKQLNEVAANLRKEMDPKRDELVTLMARNYASKFTEAELKDLLAFYKSPLGKKMITDEPQVIDQSMARVQSWSNSFSEQMLVRLRADMKKRGYDM
ncbi:MAG TPA: DUF2059 domain-containing protein [Pseudorhodoplanes sp.]|jgi:hypothetical protein|nr:DUF2059 domain-containing protein [Pseudorhodoplanes sp.]